MSLPRLSVFCAAVVALSLTPLAMADFVPGTFTCTFADDPGLVKHSYTFDDSLNELTLHEGSIYVTGQDPSVTVSGDLDGDPIFRVIEDIDNTTGFAWTAWKIDLSGDQTFVTSYTPTSSHFLNYAFSNANQTLTFISPNAVPDGDTVTLSYKINVPTSSGAFSFVLTQTAIPEPMTVALLGAGSLLFLRRRRA